MVKSKSWNEIFDFYKKLKMQNMADFIEQILNSKYAHGIYATTSMHSLWISQNPEFEIDKNMLRIEFVGDTFVFIYKESPYLNKEWRKESDKNNGFSTFEHIMKRLKWFLN
jgi:hypothetical protein